MKRVLKSFVFLIVFFSFFMMMVVTTNANESDESTISDSIKENIYNPLIINDIKPHNNRVDSLIETGQAMLSNKINVVRSSSYFTTKRDGDYEYYVGNDDTAIIVKYHGSSKNIKLPETLHGITVTGVEPFSTSNNPYREGAFYNKGIESVFFPESYTFLGEGSFHRNTIKEVVFENKNMQVYLFENAPPFGNQINGIKPVFIGPKNSLLEGNFLFESMKFHAQDQGYSFINGDAVYYSTNRYVAEWRKEDSVNVMLHGEGYDNSKPTQYSWSTSISTPSNGWTNFSNDSRITAPSNSGNHYLHVRATNLLGGTFNFSLTTPFKIDQTLPTVSISKNGGDWASNHALTLSSNDNHSGINTFQYRWTTSTAFPTSGWTTAPRPEGTALSTPTSSGNHYLHARVTDKAGNIRQFTSNAFKVDRTAPTMPTINAPSGWQKANQSITISHGSDGHSGVARTQYRLNNGSWTNYSSAVSITTNGTTTVQARTIDNAGNISGTRTATVQIDKIKPTLNLSRSTTANTNGNVKITATGTDSHSGIKRIRQGSGSWVNGSSTTFTATANGTYSFTVEDNAGNTTTQSITISNIDKTAPTVSLSQNGGGWSQSHSTKINASDSGSGLNTVQYRWTTSTAFPTSGWTTGSNGTTVSTPTSTGNHYLHVRATDKAGNERKFTSSVFRTDRTAPNSPTINAPTTWQTSNVSVSLTHGTDGNSGVDRSQYRIGSGSWTNYSSAFSITANGESTVQARTIDKAGNISSTTSKVIKIDKVKPTLSLTPNTTEPTDRVIITAKGTDAHSGVKRIQKPDGTWTNGSSTTYEVTSNGTYKFVVEDNVGHQTTQSIEINNIEYLWEANGDGTVTILEYLGDKRAIEIPSRISGMTVTILDQNSFSGKELQSVVIPNTVKSIKQNAFSLNNIKELVIPNSVTSIGNGAFALNEMTKVTLGTSLTTIGDNAFGSNELLSVTIPSSVKTIGEFAFDDNQLISVNFSNGVTTIGTGAFQDNNLVSVSLPTSITEIHNNVFAYNKIKSFTIPESLKTIGSYAFYENQITKLEVPENVTTIGSNAFDSNNINEVSFYNDSTSIGNNTFRANQTISTELTVYGFEPSTAKTHAEANNYRFIPFGMTEYEWIDNGDGTATITKYKGNNKSIVIPPVLDGLEVTILGPSSFKDKDLTSVEIPEAVTRIAEDVFSGNNLTTISLPDGLERIGDNAFAGNNLSSITIPDKVFIIGYSAFKDNNISTVTLGEKVRSIGNEAFANNKISKITILDHVRTIGSNALAGNQSNAKNLTISGYDPSDAKRYADVNNHTFFNLLENDYEWVRLSNNTAKITKYVGNEIDLDIISRLGGLEVTQIGTRAFENKGLTNVRIPNTVTTVENNAFANNKLTGVTISNSVRTIGNDAFIGNQITDLVIPNNVTSLGTRAFANNKLEYLTIGTGLTNLQANVFSGNNLTEVTIPENITTVGQNAFQNNRLTKVFILNDAVTINGNAFNNNQSTPANLTIYGYDPSTAKTHANNNNYSFEVLASFSEDSQIQIINNAEVDGSHYATRNIKYEVSADGVFDRDNNHKQNYYMVDPNVLKDNTIDYSFSYEYTNHYQKNYKCVDQQGSDCFEWEFVNNTPVWSEGETSTWASSLEVDHNYGETFAFDETSTPEIKLVTERTAKLNGNESSSITKGSSEESFTVDAESTVLETQTWKQVAEEIKYNSDRDNDFYFKPENMFYFPHDLDSNLRSKYQNATAFSQYSDYALPLRVGQHTDDSIVFNTADNFYVTKNTGYQFSLPHSVSALAQIQSNAKSLYESDMETAYDDEVLTDYFDASKYYLNIDGNAEQEPDTFYDDDYVIGQLGLSDVTFHLNEKLKFEQYLLGHALDNPTISEQQESVIEDVEYTDSVTIDSEIMNEVKQIANERNDLVHGFRSSDVLDKYNQLQDIFSFLE